MLAIDLSAVYQGFILGFNVGEQCLLEKERVL